MHLFSKKQCFKSGCRGLISQERGITPFQFYWTRWKSLFEKTFSKTGKVGKHFKINRVSTKLPYFFVNFCAWSAIFFFVICANQEVFMLKCKFPADHDIFKNFDQNWKFQHRIKRSYGNASNNLKFFIKNLLKIWLCYFQYWLLSVIKT